MTYNVQNKKAVPFRDGALRTFYFCYTSVPLYKCAAAERRNS